MGNAKVDSLLIGAALVHNKATDQRNPFLVMVEFFISHFSSPAFEALCYVDSTNWINKQAAHILKIAAILLMKHFPITGGCLRGGFFKKHFSAFPQILLMT